MMILGIPANMEEGEQTVVIPLIIKGFKNKAQEAGCKISGGDTKITPCCIIGGTATSVCTFPEIIMPDNTCVGDAIVLTKPLGTQAATMIYSWLENEEKRLSIRTVKKKKAVKSMVQLNKTAAELMHEFGAHGATDVTGFGLLRHA